MKCLNVFGHSQWMHDYGNERQFHHKLLSMINKRNISNGINKNVIPNQKLPAHSCNILNHVHHNKNGQTFPFGRIKYSSFNNESLTFSICNVGTLAEYYHAPGKSENPKYDQRDKEMTHVNFIT